MAAQNTTLRTHHDLTPHSNFVTRRTDPLVLAHRWRGVLATSKMVVGPFLRDKGVSVQGGLRGVVDLVAGGVRS